MVYRFTLAIDEDTLALERVISAVRRRSFQIRSLEYKATKGVGVVALVVESDEHEAKRLEANLWKLNSVLNLKCTSLGAPHNRKLTSSANQSLSSQDRSMSSV